MEITRGVTKKAYKVVVYGPEGIGKSTFASRFPNPLFIDTEGSTDTMDVARLPRPESWDALLSEVDYILTETPPPCGTLVIDTADWAERLCIESVCRNAHVSGIEDIGYGKGYVYAQEAFALLLDKLEQLTRKGIHVVITAHAMMRKFEQPDELGAYDRWELKLSRKVSPLLKEWSDLLLFANYQTHVTTTKEGKKKAVGGARVMYAAHHACWDAKNRVGLPEQMDFDYREISRLFEGTAAVSANPDPSPAAQEAPKPEQTAEAIEEAVAEQILKDPGIRDGRKKAPAKARVTAIPLDESGPPANLGPEWAGIPPRLAGLMTLDGITPDDLRAVVAEKGYYTYDTPISNYDPAFLDTFLITVWGQVKEAVLKMREKDPF